MRLCPCCANRMEPDALECSCGARAVGDPLHDSPFKVLIYGPVIVAVAAALAVAFAALVFTSWAALGVVFPILLSRRAFLLTKRDRLTYGGYRAATATLELSLAATILLGSYAVIRIPVYLERQQISQQAAERAKGLHVASLLEQYRSQNDGSYPKDLEPIKQLDGGSLPPEFWSKMVSYKASGEVAANRRGAGDAGLGSMAFNDFELRLAGPDGILGTDDDIIMRDGLFYSNSDPVRTLPGEKSPGPLKPAPQK